MNSVFVKTALLPKGWADSARIDIDDAGDITNITTDVPAANSGCAIPGIANCHSHAHQRAMAGLAERSQQGEDNFWTWRSVMYAFLDRISPDELYAIASQLYIEMLKAGYTRVAEFQYLHHQQDGTPYANIAEMSLQTLAAASELGLGMTSLPVHYQFGGFDGQTISNQQRRFATNPAQYLEILERLAKERNGDNVNIGVAAHSLRSVTKESFSEVLSGSVNQTDGPIHLHIAEQIKEVEDCVAWSGRRPVEYLYDHFEVDSNWCLIHATHMTDQETTLLAQSGAVAGLCPTTEANLGDGFFNATQFLNENGRFAIGSDSHISISPTEELRWLEYGQRLLHRSRNQLSPGPNCSTGRALFDRAVTGGAQACAHNAGSIEIGRRADFVVLDDEHALLCDKTNDEYLDSWIFSGNANLVRDVYVGGQLVIEQGHHVDEDKVERRFKKIIKSLRE